MISALNSALQGMQSNQRSMNHHADRISRWGTQDTGSPQTSSAINLQDEVVGVMKAQRGFEANLAVVRAEDEMLGSLIDVLA